MERCHFINLDPAQPREIGLFPRVKSGDLM
jgi:hypothetical protein